MSPPCEIEPARGRSTRRLARDAEASSAVDQNRPNCTAEGTPRGLDWRVGCPHHHRPNRIDDIAQVRTSHAASMALSVSVTPPKCGLGAPASLWPSACRRRRAGSGLSPTGSRPGAGRTPSRPRFPRLPPASHDASPPRSAPPRATLSCPGSARLQSLRIHQSVLAHRQDQLRPFPNFLISRPFAFLILI